MPSTTGVVYARRAATEDVYHLYELAMSNPAPWVRRSFVRAVFAFVEGISYGMKQAALVGDHPFEPHEVAVLEESAPFVKDGKPAVRSMQISHPDNVRVAFDALARSLRCANPIDTSTQGWMGFRQALTVRDRLMHPKRTSDLHVTDAEFDSAFKTYGWFLAAFFRLYSDFAGYISESEHLGEQERDRAQRLSAIAADIGNTIY